MYCCQTTNDWFTSIISKLGYKFCKNKKTAITGWLSWLLHSLAISWVDYTCGLGTPKDIKLNRMIPYSSWQFHMQHSVCLKIPHFITKGNGCYEEFLIVWQRHGEDGFLVVSQGSVVLPALPVAFVTRDSIVTGGKQNRPLSCKQNIHFLANFSEWK